MKVETIAEDGEELRLRVSADAEDVERAFCDGLDAFVVQYGLSEVEGEDSRAKIVAAMGDDADEAIYSAVVNYLVPFALSEADLTPLSTYGIESDEAPQPGEAFAFEMTVIPKPDFELSSYEKVLVAIDEAPEVTESDIDEQVAMLVRQVAASGVPGADAPIVEGTPEAPKVTDAWVAEHLAADGLSTVDELRERFRAASREELASRYEQAKMAAAMEQYATRFTGQISQKMIDAMTQELFETFVAQLAAEGTSFADFSAQQGMSEDDVRATLAAQAEAQLTQGFILEAIFRHEQLTLEPSDIAATLRNMAPGNEDATLEALRKTGRTFLLKEAASRMKAASWIMENTDFAVRS